MSMNTYANIAMTVEGSGIAKIAPVEYEKFNKLFTEVSERCDDLSCDSEFGFMGNEDEDVLKELSTLLDELMTAVYNACGMRPQFGYHEHEEGDDIDGWYWEFEFYDVFVLSPNAQKLHDRGINIIRCGYTTFG